MNVGRDIGDVDRLRACGSRRVADAPSILGLLEERQHILETPTRIAQFLPVIEVARQAAVIDHGIDGAGAAQYLAARPECGSSGKRRIGLRLVQPVNARVVKGAAVAYRQLYPEAAIRNTGFQNENLALSALSKTARHDPSGRARANHDVIEDVHSKFLEGVCTERPERA